MKGRNFSQGQANVIPSRSGSAPPSMEGSVAAVGNMLPVKDSNLIDELNQGITASVNGCTAYPSTMEASNKNGSSKQASEGLVNPSNFSRPGKNAVPSASVHKSLVDLIQV